MMFHQLKLVDSIFDTNAITFDTDALDFYRAEPRTPIAFDTDATQVSRNLSRARVGL